MSKKTFPTHILKILYRCLFFLGIAIFLPAIEASSILNPSEALEEKEPYNFESGENLYDPSKDSQIQIETLIDLKKQIPIDVPKDKELILFVGSTGVGKSTTINFLRGVPLISIQPTSKRRKRRKKRTVIAVDPNHGFDKIATIGESIRSCTQWPECYYQKDFDLTLCDLPGLFDTHGTERQIVIALSTKRIMKQTRALKAITFLFSKQNLLSQKGSAFTEVVKSLTNMLKKPQNFMSSIYFGFTKTEDWLLKDFIEEIEAYIKFLEEEITKECPSFMQCCKKILHIKPDSNDANIAPFTKNERLSGLFSEQDMYNLSDQDKEKTTLYLFLKNMIEEYEDHFFIIDPLNNSTRAPILQTLAKSKSIPNNALKFVGTQNIHTLIKALYRNTIMQGLHFLHIVNNYPRKLCEKQEVIASNQKAITDKDESPFLENGRIKKEIYQVKEHIDMSYYKIDALKRRLRAYDEESSYLLLFRSTQIKRDRPLRFYEQGHTGSISIRSEYVIRCVRIHYGSCTLKKIKEKRTRYTYDCTICVAPTKGNVGVSVVWDIFVFKGDIEGDQALNFRREIHWLREKIVLQMLHLGKLRRKALEEYINHRRSKGLEDFIKIEDLKHVNEQLQQKVLAMNEKLKQAQSYLQQYKPLLDMIIDTWSLVYDDENLDIFQYFVKAYKKL